MSKRFLVEPGYLARIGSCWYDNRVTMFVVEDERVEIFRRAAMGKPPTHISSHDYRDLDPAFPPVGLYRLEWH